MSPGGQGKDFAIACPPCSKQAAGNGHADAATWTRPSRRWPRTRRTCSSKDLDASVNDLEKMRDLAKSLQQMQQQMEQMGKDLAEQLKNGQPEAAQATLQKPITPIEVGQSHAGTDSRWLLMAEVSKRRFLPPANMGKWRSILKAAARKWDRAKNRARPKSTGRRLRRVGKIDAADERRTNHRHEQSWTR